MLLEGIFLPLTTPFRSDGRLYLRKLEANVARYSLAPAAGMLVLGSSSEVDGLTDVEAREVLLAAIGAAADEKVMIAGVGRESVAGTLALAEAAATAGYDAIALRGPAFAANPAMRPELMTYFQAVADRSELPVVLLSEGERTVAVGAMEDLAGHRNVIGAVDAGLTKERMERLRDLTSGVSRDVMVTPVFAAVTRRMQKHGKRMGDFVSLESLGAGAAAFPLAAGPAVKTRSRRVGFQVLVGSAETMLEAWSGGAVGAVPRLGACAPQACCEVWQAFRDGDPALAEEKQERIATAGRLMEGWTGVVMLKYGCDLNGYFGGRPRLPLLPPTGAQRELVELELSGLKN